MTTGISLWVNDSEVLFGRFASSQCQIDAGNPGWWGYMLWTCQVIFHDLIRLLTLRVSFVGPNLHVESVFCGSVAPEIHGKAGQKAAVWSSRNEWWSFAFGWLGTAPGHWGWPLPLLPWPHSVSRDLLSIQFMPGIMPSVLLWVATLCSEAEFVLPVFYLKDVPCGDYNNFLSQ